MRNAAPNTPKNPQINSLYKIRLIKRLCYPWMCICVTCLFTLWFQSFACFILILGNFNDMGLPKLFKFSLRKTILTLLIKHTLAAHILREQEWDCKAFWLHLHDIWVELKCLEVEIMKNDLSCHKPESILEQQHERVPYLNPSPDQKIWFDLKVFFFQKNGLKIETCVTHCNIS